MKVTKVGEKGLALIKKFEGFKAKPYICSGGAKTIGYGSTYYPNGTRVTMNDKAITEGQASTMLMNILTSYEKSVDSFCRDDINQNQFDALCAFAYNVGVNALKNSTLLKKVNKNPQDVTIRNEFLKWNKAAGKVLKGLTNRRVAEANLYAS
jgi:lysozyme